MDFHSLARRDLQSLCKKNRVPANLTNAAMAKALEALETVEGIEEIQEALGFQSPKVKLPKLSHGARRTSSRDEPKIQQQVTVKTPEVTEMASKEEEIQEPLGFQSLKVNSPELPRTSRSSSVRRAAIGEEPKIQKRKPLHRSRRAAAKDLEVREMASMEEEVEKKEVPTIFPKTPATRKAVKGVEAQSSRRGAKKKEEVEDHTETPKEVEAKGGGKAIGVVTRRSTRLSSRNAMEETATNQSKSRSGGRENAAVKMGALAKEDTGEKEKEEEKKDLVEYGDSCAVIENECEATHGDVPMIQQKQLSKRTQPRRVTTKAQEAIKIVSGEEDDKKAPKLLKITRQSTRVSSKKSVEEKSGEDGIFKKVALTKEDGEKQEKEEEKKDLAEKNELCGAAPSHANSSFNEIVEEVEENDQEVEIHDFSSSTQGKGSNIEVENDDSIVVFVEEEEKKDQNVDSQEYSSSIEVENGDSIVALVDEVEENDQEVKIYSSSLLIEDDGEKQEIEEKKDLTIKSDLCILAPYEEDEEKDQEAEIHDFSSYTQGKGSNNEVENYDSIVVFVEEDEKKDQKVESQEYSSSIEVKNEDSIVALVDEVEENNQKMKIHGFSLLTKEDGEKQEKEEEKDLAVKSDLCVVPLDEEDTERDQKVESHALSSFIEMENRESNVALIEEVEENDQEVEIHDFSSSTQGKGSNIEVENDDSIVVFVEGDEKKDKSVEIQDFSLLTKEDGEKQEKVEEKKDFVEKSDSYNVALVEEDVEKDQKVDSHSYFSLIEMENRKTIALVEEVEETNQEVEIHDFSSSTQGKVSNIEVENDDSIVVFIEGDEKKDQKVESQEYSSSIEVENVDSIVALADEVEENDQEVKIHGFSLLSEEDGEKQEKEEEKKDLTAKSDFCVVAPNEDAEKDQKVETHAHSSFIGMESIVALVEEVEENNQEVEIHDFSSSTQGKGLNNEVENDVIIEWGKKKDQKIESQEYSSSIEVENGDSVVALIDEVEENNQEVKIHDFSLFIEDGEKQEKEEENKDFAVKRDVAHDEKDAKIDKKVESHTYSSFIEMENRESIVALVDEVEENHQEEKIHSFSLLIEEDGEKQEKEEEKKDIAEKSDLCVVVSLDEEDAKKDQKVEIYNSSSSIEIKNKESIVVFAEEVEEKEIHGFSSSTQEGKGSNIEVKNDHSIAVFVEGDKMKDQKVESQEYSSSIEVENGDSIAALVDEVKIHGFSSSAQRVGSNIEVQNDDSTVALVNEGEMKDQRVEIYSSSTEVENVDSIIALVEKDEENDQQVIHGSSFSSQKDSNIEVHENDFVEDSSNQGSEFVEVSDALLPTNEAVEDSGDHSSHAGLDGLLCSETPPLPHKEAIVQTQPSEFEEGKEEVFLKDENLELSSKKPPLPHKEAIVETQPSEFEEGKEEVFLKDENLELSTKIPPLPHKEAIVQTQPSEFEEDKEEVFLKDENLELPSKTPPLPHKEAIVETQPSEFEEDKEEVFLKDENLELLSLTKLRSMYKQILNGTKNEQERKKSIIKQEDLDYSSCIKNDENCNQKLNDGMIKLRKSPLIKQEDLECLSRSKLDSNCKLKLNDDKIKSERKRTPLKNLNYSALSERSRLDF